MSTLHILFKLVNILFNCHAQFSHMITISFRNRCRFCRKLVFLFHKTKYWTSLDKAIWHHKKFSSVSSPENIILFIVDYNFNNNGALPPHASHNRQKTHILMSILQILSEKKWATRTVLQKMQHFMLTCM